MIQILQSRMTPPYFFYISTGIEMVYRIASKLSKVGHNFATFNDAPFLIERQYFCLSSCASGCLDVCNLITSSHTYIWIHMRNVIFHFMCCMYSRVIRVIITMAQCKTVVTILLTHWSYSSFAHNHRFGWYSISFRWYPQKQEAS